MRRFSQPGNTLSEYAIIIGLLSLLGVGGLSLLGNSVSDLLSSASRGTGSHSMQGYLDSTLGTGVTGAGQGGGNAGNNAPQPAQMAVAVAPNSGQNSAITTINAQNPLTANNTGGGTNATSVDGVGMVKSQADRLTRLVQEIQADPDHDPALLNMVTSLANLGHNAGDAITTGAQEFYTARIASASTSPLDVVTIAASSSMSKTLQANTDFQQTAGQLETYLAAHPNLLTQEQLATVQAASKDISGVLDTLTVKGSTGTAAANFKQPGWNALAVYIEQSSGQVHTDSNTICKNGGNQQVCVK